MNGVVLIDKPLGLSSNAVLQRVKRLLGVRKAGHTGSLDPLATGMLPICLGEATKFAQYWLNADKHYEVQGQLGIITDTGDAEGQVIARHEGVCTESSFHAVLSSFLGRTQQLPPMYSALKHQGKPLYAYARAGMTIEREKRWIDIHDLSLQFFKFPNFGFRVTCSKGTYIRSLVLAIGEQLNLGAYVTALHRPYTVGLESFSMVTLDALEAMPLAERWHAVLSMPQVLHHLPVYALSSENLKMLQQGQRLSVKAEEAGLVQLCDTHEVFIGVGEITLEGQLKVKRLCAY